MERPTSHRPTVKVFAVAPFDPPRAGIREGLARAADVDVIGDCATLYELLGHASLTRADVLLIDASVLADAEDAVYARLRALLPVLRVLFIGTPAEAASMSIENLRFAIKANSVGFLYRDGAIDRFIEGIRLVASGAFVCENEVLRQIINRVMRRGSGPTPEPPAVHLSQREKDVLRLVAAGHSNRQIGSALSVSEGTVKAHVSHIMAKVGVDRRTELVRYAITRGFDAVV